MNWRRSTAATRSWRRWPRRETAAIGQLLSWVAEEAATRRTERPEQPGDRDVVIWSPTQLPIDGLTPALADMDFHLIEPKNLHDPAERERARHACSGITGVDAASAATGTVVLGAGPNKVGPPA